MSEIDPDCRATAEIYWRNGYVHGLDFAYRELKRIKAEWRQVFFSAKYREDLEIVMETIATHIVNSETEASMHFIPKAKA